MLHATLRSLLARKLRLVLSGIAIILGVATVAGSFVLTDTIGKVFDDIFSKGLEKTAVVVRGEKTDVSDQRSTVPASLVTAVKAVPGVEAAFGGVTGYAQLVDKKGKTYPYHNGPPAIGFSFDSDTRIAGEQIRQGRPPAGPDEIVIDQFTAKKLHYVVGDRVPVLSLHPRKTYTIVGIFTSGDNENTGGASLVAFDPTTAQAVLGRPGEVDQIFIGGASGVSDTELRSRVATVLPKGVEAVTGKQQASDQADEIKQGLTFFLTFLLIFAGISLFVGAFIIFNTFSMLVAQRVRELALMRAIGASRRQVVNAVLVEAVVIGFIASTIGLGVGVLLAIGLRALLDAFGGGGLPNGSLVIAPRTIITSYAVGVLVTAVAALVPARRAARIPPMAALRDAALPDPSLRRSTITGSLLLVLGVLALVPGLQGNFPLLGVGAIFVFLGVAGLSPLLARPVVRLLSWPFQRKVPGRLGRRNAMRNPRRTSTTAGALMIGLALVSAVSVLGASLKTSIGHVIDRAFAADFVVQSKSFDGGVPPAVGNALEKKSEFAQVDRLAFGPAKVGGNKTFLTALPNRAIGVTVALARVSGDLRLGPGQLLVDKSTAKSHSWKVGQQLTVVYERGSPHQLTLAGTYKDNGLAGPYLVDEGERTNFLQRLDGVLLVKTAPGVSPDAARAALTDVVKDYPNDEVKNRKEFIGQTVDSINGLLAFITALLILSVLIAVIGIINTLALSVIERTRELGLLRAVGLSRRQTRSMIRTEAIVVALFGAVLGLVVGTALGVAITKALADQGVDSLTFPWVRMIVFVVVAALAGILAAILPARRASRLNVLDAIATE
ncbi:MAG: putative transport system permease protein [Frankiales bacterium]|nr:putative transport system permease protein [Frankiales bacterium]